MSDKGLVLEISVVDGGEVVETLEITDDKIKIGKLATSQVQLDDPSVSRIHAVLESKGDGVYQAIDLGSASGTYVNGQKITKQKVGDGDELQVGDITLRLAVIDLEARRREQEAQAQAQEAQALAEVPEGWVRLEDGSVVEPFTMEGYYDDGGNYIPGFYDYEGVYHYGYGYYDDEGEWQVAHGFYDPEGEWVPTEAPEGEAVSDTELYTANFFSDRGGPVLEIAHLWTDTVHKVQSYKTPRSVLIGSDEANEYVVAGTHFEHPKFPLIVHDGRRGYRINLLPTMEGQVQRGNEVMSIQDLLAQPAAKESKDFKGAKTLELSRGTKVRIDLGPNTFLVHFTKMPAAVAGGGSLDRAPFVYQSLSLALHVAFMLLVFMLPDGYGGLELHDHQAADRFAELAMEPEEEEEEDLDEDWLDDVEDADEVEAEAADEDEVVEDEDIQVEGDEEVDDSEMQVARDREIAADTGALAAFSGDRQDALGGDAATALAALDTEHSAAGVGGLGLAGAGRGGAEGDEGFGRESVGTGGPGAGGAPDAELDERDTLEPQVIPEDPVTTGALDREIIQRVVRQHRREIQHCYEQQLQRNPDLAGRVTMQWVISPTGEVVTASVEESSLNDSSVEQCMAQRIQRWSFPEPDGGGVVRVNYPFNFTA